MEDGGGKLPPLVETGCCTLGDKSCMAIHNHHEEGSNGLICRCPNISPGNVNFFRGVPKNSRFGGLAGMGSE